VSSVLAPLPASALILSGTGNRPVRDAGWPEGALAVANLESRTGWWEGPPFGGGEWHFLYRGDAEAFEKALETFAAIRAAALDLVIHDGPQEDSILKQKVEWAFTVWVPKNWHRLYNNPKSVFDANNPHFRQPGDPPRLDVYIGGGQVEWAKVKVPANLHVRDQRASAAAGSIHGAVTDEKDRPLSRYEGHELLINIEPKAGAKVGSWGGGATVKDDGTFEFDNVPPGEYRITSRPNPSNSNRQYAPEQIITVTPGGPTQVKVIYAADRAEGGNAASPTAIDDFVAEHQTKSAKPAPKQPEPTSK
jgi:hypothetical protein